MNHIFRLPLLPVFAAYTLGLFLGHFDLPLPSQGLLWLLLLLLVGWVFLAAIRKIAWSSWVILVLFFFLGTFSIYTYLHPDLSSSHISKFIGFDRIAVEGTIDGPAERSADGVRLMV